VDLAVLADAGFDLAHAFDPARAGIAMFVDPARPAGWLVGNTRALWPRFVAARRADRELDAAEHPLERYTEAAIERALSGSHGRAWFGHRTYAEGTFIPLQAVAVASGLGTLAPTGLVIHPVFGPWFALRAVIVEPGEPPPPRAPIAPACTCDAPCLDALARAQAARGPEAWRAWLAVRDACPVGRDHRYSDDQVLYHYGRNRDRLA
jgi:methylmalonic aciduria homocystinuria type C protein